MAEAAPPVNHPVKVPRWSSERPLQLLVWLAAIGLWIALAVSIVGIAYVALLGIFFFVAHLMFIAHLRGNSVRLGPEQMPELYARVAALAERIGMRRVPDTYVVQAGGALNALATKFLRANFIVLFSDLLEACGDNTDARDFIIAHELGHLHAGHLRLRWLLLPGLFIPFLGTAYSRACEYTCDRYGLAASSNGDRALDGLCILAAGGEHGPKVNRRALVAQRSDMNTVFMKIGHWLSTHPPIAHRLAALRPTLAEGRLGGGGATAGALFVLLLVVALPVGAGVGAFATYWPEIQAALQAQQRPQQAQQSAPPAYSQSAPQPAPAVLAAPPDDARQRTEAGILSLVEAAELHRESTFEPPSDVDMLYEVWSSYHPNDPLPMDPYDGNRFGYHVQDGEYFIWSTGPDPNDDSDNLYYSSAAARGQQP